IEDVFTSPLREFTRIILSDCYSSDVSEPHQSILDDDIRMVARGLRKVRSNAWLSPLQDNDLTVKIREQVTKLFEDIALRKIKQVRSFVDLTKMCLSHSLPLPFDPYFSMLTVVTCLLIYLRTLVVYSKYEKSRRYVRVKSHSLLNPDWGNSNQEDVRSKSYLQPALRSINISLPPMLPSIFFGKGSNV
ncbi:hypothetical protein PMAYCL1PPCAC_09310, partial [Pristionchus mayeri]